MRWAYKMDLHDGDNTYRITSCVWMFMMEDAVVVNGSDLRKLRITFEDLPVFVKK